MYVCVCVCNVELVCAVFIVPSFCACGIVSVPVSFRAISKPVSVSVSVFLCVCGSICRMCCPVCICGCGCGCVFLCAHLWLLLRFRGCRAVSSLAHTIMREFSAPVLVCRCRWLMLCESACFSPPVPCGLCSLRTSTRICVEVSGRVSTGRVQSANCSEKQRSTHSCLGATGWTPPAYSLRKTRQGALWWRVLTSHAC